MKISPEAKLFTKAHETDACYDIYVATSYIVHPFKTIAMSTGIRVEIPEGYEGIIRPRSGLSLNTPLRVANSPGTIDSGYRGEVKVLMTNYSDTTQLIHKGDRIAQFTVKPVLDFDIEIVDELSETKRGTDGFGSTGA